MAKFKQVFTESQNHRMFGFGKDLCGSSSPTLLPKQGHLQQAAQDLSRRVLNISREGESTASLGSLFQCFVTLRVKKFFLIYIFFLKILAHVRLL